MSTASSDAFRIGRVLTTGFRVCTRHYLLFFALAFVAYLPSLALDLLRPLRPPVWKGIAAPEVQAAGIEPTVQAATPWLVMPLFLAAMVLGFILSAAATYIMIADLRGTRFSLGEALAGGVRALLPQVGVFVILLLMLLGLAFLVGLIWAVIAIGLGSPKTPYAALLIPVFAIPVAIVCLKVSLVVPAIVAERMGAIDSMKRSAELTQGRLWRLLGLFVAAGLIALVINGALFGFTVAALGRPALLSPMFSVAGHTVLAAEIPFYWAIIAVAYYYLRVASEGSGAPVHEPLPSIPGGA